jgi:hypothetical protein
MESVAKVSETLRLFSLRLLVLVEERSMIQAPACSYRKSVIVVEICGDWFLIFNMLLLL